MHYKHIHPNKTFPKSKDMPKLHIHNCTYNENVNNNTPVHIKVVWKLRMIIVSNTISRHYTFMDA